MSNTTFDNPCLICLENGVDMCCKYCSAHFHFLCYKLYNKQICPQCKKTLPFFHENDFNVEKLLLLLTRGLNLFGKPKNLTYFKCLRILHQLSIDEELDINELLEKPQFEFLKILQNPTTSRTMMTTFVENFIKNRNNLQYFCYLF